MVILAFFEHKTGQRTSGLLS